MLPVEAIVSGILHVLLAFFVGLMVTAGFLLSPGEMEKIRRRLLARGLSSLLAFILIACVSLLIQGAKLRGGALPFSEVIFRYLTMTEGGKIWLARELYAAALTLSTLWLARRQATLTGMRSMAALALPLLASRSLISHAVADRDHTALVVAADAVHLIATSLWGGGLLALCWVLYGRIKELIPNLSGAAEMVDRFSALAFASVAVLMITGLYQSWIQVGGLTSLFGTDYGRVLIVKILLFLAMLGLGAVNWLSTKPRLFRAAHEHTQEIVAARQALKTIGAESLLALLVFLVTGLLTTLPPGVHAMHQAILAESPSSAPATSREALPLSPAEGASVEILAPANGQTLSGDKVPLAFKLTKGKRGDHVHAYVDGELMGMFMSTQGTLNGIKPGRHVLELRVVAEDHQTELDARDRIEFVIKR